MFSAIGRISSGREPGTPRTHFTSSARLILHTSSSAIPRTFGARAAAERRDPPHSGHGSSRRNRATRFIPLSSLTFESAFSTVCTALK